MHKLTNVFNYTSLQALQVRKEGVRNLGCKALARPGMSQYANGIIGGIYIENASVLVESFTDFTAC